MPITSPPPYPTDPDAYARWVASPPALRSPVFYDSPFVRALRDEPRWTVSDKDKRPMDMRAFIERGVLYGAKTPDEQCLVTLDELDAAIPNSANAAFRLRSMIDGFAILDIEKTCPPDVADKLLALPSLYTEHSMSGRGYHLVLPLPRNLHEHPIAAAKGKLQSKDRHYEILLEHYVTFTRWHIPQQAMLQSIEDASEIDPEDTRIEELFAELAADAKPSPSVTGFVIEAETPPEIPGSEMIIDHLAAMPVRRTLADFDEDHSRFEFSIIGSLQHRLEPYLEQIRAIHPHEYTEEEKAWLIYLASLQLIEPRPKHATRRYGMPLLLATATSILARRKLEVEESEESENDTSEST